MSVIPNYALDSEAPGYGTLLERIYADHGKRGAYGRSARAIIRAAFAGAINPAERTALIDALDNTKKHRIVRTADPIAHAVIGTAPEAMNPGGEDNWSPTAGIADEAPARELDTKERAAGEC